MAYVNAELQMIIENVLKGVMLKTTSGNVIVNDETGETLATRLATIAGGASGYVSRDDMESYVTTKLSELIDGAPETANTLLELANLIGDNAEVIETLNSAIGNKVDKVSGKGLSSNDFTTALLNKLNGITENATKVVKSNTNGHLTINGEDVTVYAHPVGEGYHHLPSGGSVGQVLKAKGAGQGEWGVAIRSGASAPDNLLPGEVFIKIL